MEDYRSPYDDLSLVKVVFFLALILLVNFVVLAVVYPGLRDAPFRGELNEELEWMARFFGPHLSESIKRRGDWFYDTALVRTGIERGVYDYFLSRPDTDATREIWTAARFGPLLDNVFDYLLLMAYRLSGVGTQLTAGLIVALVIASDALTRRRRRRYAFGDAAILVSIWSRGVFAVLLPASVIVILLPVAIYPVVTLATVAVLSLTLTIFLLFLPKIA
ncbi:MAG: hypothetical protein DI556_13450 [Rhodovulum sulfidophilum]|uniref:DUF4400 domain-containing protein n=1 Tax=Rhodovulum sulfidophilum TaxID=35806 RepID=A0A2W5NDK8_RHOSU|nr:MAG: hypothetical protein DI556_13450 [Rhodovulum sulfidophilum]